MLFYKKLVGEKNPWATSLTEWTPHFNGFFGVVQTGSTLCSRVKMITVKVVVHPQQVQLGSEEDVSNVHVVESYIRGWKVLEHLHFPAEVFYESSTKVGVPAGDFAAAKL